jgi:hypothetical protein
MAFVKRIAGATALGVAMLTGYGLSSTPAQAGYVVIFRLITNSYLVGAWTGRSPGFSPLRMRST